MYVNRLLKRRTLLSIIIKNGQVVCIYSVYYIMVFIVTLAISLKPNAKSRLTRMLIQRHLVIIFLPSCAVTFLGQIRVSKFNYLTKEHFVWIFVTSKQYLNIYKKALKDFSCLLAICSRDFVFKSLIYQSLLRPRPIN